MKNRIVALFSLVDPLPLIKDFHYLVISIIEPLRPGRKEERKKGIHRRVFHFSYKSIS